MERYGPHRLMIMVATAGMLLLSMMIGTGTANASSVTPSSAYSAQPQASYSSLPASGDQFYGANGYWMNLAVDSNHANWPQHRDYWCGVASIAAINWYDQIKTFGLNVSPTWKTQESIGDDTRGHLSGSNYYPPDSSNGVLNTSSAISPWGQAQSGSPAVKANIAGDSGTDPRSLSWAIWTVTPNGFYFHNWIYQSTATQATYYFGSDFGPAHGLNDPIMVDINQGDHTFVVDGVYATSDPSAGGETIDSIDTWDPLVGNGKGWGSYNTSDPEVWSTYDWTNKQYSSGAYLFKMPYSKTANGGYDPEPSTNPGYYNAPTSSVPNHWNGFYVTVEQDEVTRCNASPDIAYDKNGNEVPHNGSAYCP